MLGNEELKVKISGDASNLVNEANKGKKAVEGIGGNGFAKVKGEIGNLASELNLIPDSAAKASSTLSAMSGSVSGIAEAAGPAGIAVGALTVGITAAVGVGLQLSKTLFDLAKQASDYGSQIYDASQKTGISTETLSALKYAADTSGSSLESVSGSVTKFSKLIADGSDESKKKLIALGLDPQTAINDLDGSLAQVFQKIADAENPIAAAKLATDAFGKSGADMIPVIKSFDGDMTGLIKTATDLGLVLSEKDAEAADAFGDTLDTLTKQTEGAGHEFAYGFMPQVTGAMSEISGVLADNKNYWRSWGEAIGSVLTGTVYVIGQMVRSAKAGIGILAAVASGDYQTAMLLYSAYDADFQKGEQAYQLGTISGSAKIKRPQPDYDFSGGGGGGGGGKGNTKRETGIDGFASNRVKAQFASAMGKLSPSLKGQIVSMAEQYGIPQALAFAQLFSESSFNTKAQSANNPGVGPAFGLTQMVAGTASRVLKQKVTGEMLKNNPQLALTGWGKYMTELFNRYHDWDLAVLAYHQGEGTVDKLVKLLDQGKSSESFFAARPKGKAYLQKVSALSGISGDKKFELSTEVSAGTAFVQKYTEAFNNLGETAHRISLEREKDFQKLSEPEKERLRAIADEWDAVEKASKASEEYSNFIEQLSAKYDEINGVQKTFTESLNDQLQKLKDNGVVLDATAEGFARYRALILDVTADEKQLNEILQKQNQLRIEERDLQNNANSGINVPHHLKRPDGAAMPSDAVRGINFESDGPAPKIRKSVSAWGIADSRAGDFKQGGIFDENTVNTQVSLMQTLKESGMDAFRSISGEIGNAAAQWLAYGDSSEQSLGKATKAILASVSAQALGTGIYHLGLGIAALTPWGAAMYGPAPVWFKSSAVLLGMGAIAGGIARAIPGGDSKGKSGGAGSSVSSSSTGQDNRQYNFLRDSSIGSNQSQTNNQLQLTVNELRASVQQLTAANKDLQSRINTQPAGVLVANGIKENRGLVSETVISEMSKNSTTANQFGRILGGT